MVHDPAVEREGTEAGVLGALWRLGEVVPEGVGRLRGNDAPKSTLNGLARHETQRNVQPIRAR